MAEPIWIECEGSGEPGNRLGGGLHCRMCGERFVGYDIVPTHRRDDLLARLLARGDFDD